MANRPMSQQNSPRPVSEPGHSGGQGDLTDIQRLAAGPERWREHLHALQLEYRGVLQAIDARSLERTNSLRSMLERSRSYDMPPSYPPSDVESTAARSSSIPDIV